MLHLKNANIMLSGSLLGGKGANERHKHDAEWGPRRGQVLPMKDANIMQNGSLVGSRCCPCNLPMKDTHIVLSKSLFGGRCCL